MPALANMTIGDTPLDTWTLTLPDGQTPVSLTGLVSGGLTLFLHNSQIENPFQGTGQFFIQNAANGVVQYQWSAQDTEQAGKFQLAVRAIFANGQQLTFGVLNQVTQTIIAP